MAAGVPKIGSGLLEHVRSEGRRFNSLKRTVIGGAAASKAMIHAFEVGHDVRVLHGWGMTETSPAATINQLKRAHAALSSQERVRLKTRQGREVFAAELRIESPDGRQLPRDGKARGHLLAGAVGRRQDQRHCACEEPVGRETHRLRARHRPEAAERNAQQHSGDQQRRQTAGRCGQQVRQDERQRQRSITRLRSKRRVSKGIDGAAMAPTSAVAVTVCPAAPSLMPRSAAIAVNSCPAETRR